MQKLNGLLIIMTLLLFLPGCGSDSDGAMEAYADMLAAESTATALAYVPSTATIEDHASGSTRIVTTDAYYEGNTINAKAAVYVYANDGNESGSGLAYETAAVFSLTGQLQYVSFTDHNQNETIRSTYAFDAEGRIIQIEVNDANGNRNYRYEFTYDDYGDKKTERHYTYSNGWNLSQSITYLNKHDNGQLTQVRVTGGDSSGAIYTYTYDPAGNLIEENLNHDGTVHISRFTYNNTGRPDVIEIFENSALLYEIAITWTQREVPLKVKDYIDNLDVRKLAGLEAGFQLPTP